MKTLAKLSESRGKEASGFCFGFPQAMLYARAPVAGSVLYTSPAYTRLSGTTFGTQPCHLAIGHTRLATHGSQLKDSNNQPVITKHFVAVHNGIITNHSQLWHKIQPTVPTPALDTTIFMAHLEYIYAQTQDFVSALHQTLTHTEGSVSLACADRALPYSLYLYSNTGSLYYAYHSPSSSYIYASEKPILSKAFRAMGWPLPDITQLSAGSLFIIKQDAPPILHPPQTWGATTSQSQKKVVSATLPPQLVPTHDLSQFYYATHDTHAPLLYSVTNNLHALQKHKPDTTAIATLRRCTRCILPATTPFITFDTRGVCNYCLTHTPIKSAGIDILRKKIAPYKKNNGDPDCLIAFSGGRDSSYGLHFLVKELGLKPLAYTYDWGMITDLGRRNQARMVSALGVEHIIVSADITAKRRHIHKHISAWMKKPDLGMVPLFMEGDKQCEFYADQLMQEYNLELMFFCRGNEYEKEEFKAGLCGVKDADPGGVIHNLSFSNKAKLAGYYLNQYLRNPAYINESIFDTLLGFFATYVQKHTYEYLWHYVPWNEKNILNTLTTQYGWECPTDTPLTWRTDDGTSAFYNYIYYVVQGFTENDSFRSRQVREGVLTRKEALEIVKQENQPRYHDLQWYFDQVGLDGDAVLSVVDGMKKRW